MSHFRFSVPLIQWLSLLYLSAGWYKAQAGICWLSVNKVNRCTRAYILNSTRESCCQTTLPTVAWTPHSNVAIGTLFYWAALGSGAPLCHRCHTTCRHVVCGPHRKCRLRRGQPRCVCSPRCSRPFRLLGPVCGTDGRSYRNYCSILKQNCRHNTDVRLAYQGTCKRSCEHVKCFLKNKVCLEDQNRLPHCVHCNINCDMAKENYICGEDSVTYNSYCHLVAAICKKGRAIRIAYSGICRANASCDSIPCPYSYKCIVNERNGLPQCANCLFECRSEQAAGGGISVCGSDNVTYPSYCHMQKVSCQKAVVIRTQKFGHCQNKKPNEVAVTRHRKRPNRAKKAKWNLT
ncbi:follistatin-A-like [Gigantopelta aegis]|uniref:follistatin-A-like n=1 Tax=Gigantopelta aegis TaxID=1735272 RepID=UPI001B88E14C|nr:follistatin-A-like [Gigantopelta aegis]